MRKILLFTITLLTAWLTAPGLARASEPPIAAPTLTLNPEAATPLNGWEAEAAGKVIMTIGDKSKPSKIELKWVGQAPATPCVIAKSDSRYLVSATSSGCEALFQDQPGKLRVDVHWKRGNQARQAVVDVSWPTHGNELVISTKGDVTEQELPFTVDVGAPWYSHSDDAGWVSYPNVSGNTVSDELTSTLKASLGDSSVRVFMRIHGSLQRVPLLRTPEPKPVVKDSPNDPPDALTPGELKTKCKEQLKSLRPKEEVSKSARRKRDQAARRNDWGYLVCVDWTSVHPRLIVLTTRKGADPAAESGGVHVYEGRPIHVHVWHREGEVISTETTGTRGAPNFIYKPEYATQAVEEALEKAAKSPHADTRASPVTGLAAGQIAKLQIKKTTGTGAAKIEQLFVHELEVTAVYLRAIRIGFSGVLAPFERRYAARASTDPNNPGSTIVTEAGVDAPLTYVELVTGYSFFFTPIYEGENTVTGGFLLGVGVLSTGGKTGIEGLSSIHAGLELDVGRDFAIAGTVSLRRTQILRDGYFIGRAVAAEESFTRFGVTPGFGLVLTWSPDFTKALGRAAKGI